MIRRKHGTKALSIVAGAGLVAVAFAGEGGPFFGQSAPTQEAVQPAEGSTATAAMDDNEFAQMVAEHHGSGIEMARFAADHAERNEVRRLARRMHDQQVRERHDLERRAIEAGLPAHKIDPQSHAHWQQMVDELHIANPADIDSIFLANMIMHHEDVIAMIQASLANLQDAQLARMAQKMIDDQTREIEEMRRMQEQESDRTSGRNE